MSRMQIRPAGPLDLLPLSMPPKVALQLDLAQRLLYSHHPLREVVSSWLGLQGAAFTLLCLKESSLLAVLQARSRLRGRSWEVDYLAVWNRGVDQAHLLWEELLVKLAREAGRHEALQLLARLPEEGHLDPFLRAGFFPFAEEVVLNWDGTAPTDDPDPEVLRTAEENDLWAIHRLYLSLTPPRVQQAEGYTPETWRLQRGEEGWVWLEDQRALAYLRCRQSSRGEVFDLLLDPACRQEGVSVLGQALMGRHPPLYLLLRSYQGELLDLARCLGFTQRAKQVLLSKPLAVPALQQQSIASRAAEPKLGAAPSAPSVGNL